jgi:restriction endonuclease S subunit
MENGPYPVINLSSYQEYDYIKEASNDGENVFISNAKAGSQGVVIQYYNGKCSHTNLLYKLVVKDEYKDKINIKFYYCYLTYKLPYIEQNFQKGSNQQSLNKDLINKWQIPIYSMNTQNSYSFLVKMIEETIKLKKTIKEQNKNKQEVLSMYSASLDYIKFAEMVEFGKVFKFEKGKLASAKVKEMEKGPYPVINLSSYQEYDYIKEASNDGENIFIKQGGAGDSMIIQYYNGKCSHTNLLYKLVVKDEYKDKINIKFYYTYLLINLPYIEESFQKGSNQQSLNKDLINKWKIPLFNEEEKKRMNRIIQLIELYDSLGHSYEEQLEKINDGINQLMNYLEN